ncbi:MAG: FTR1 family protein [Candidatus Thermoplasmatota archaeon]
MGSRQALALLALTFLMVSPALAAAAPATPIEAYATLHDALAAKDSSVARAAYDSSFAPAIAPLNGTLDASIRTALDDFSSAQNGSVTQDIASEGVLKGVLHGAFLAMEHALFVENSTSAARPWFDLLHARLGSELDMSAALWGEMGLNEAEFKEHRLLVREATVSAFGSRVREEMDEALAVWEDASEREAKGAEAWLYYQPMRPRLDAKLGADGAASLTREVESFAAAAKSGDIAEAKQARAEAMAFLDRAFARTDASAASFVQAQREMHERLGSIVAAYAAGDKEAALNGIDALYLDVYAPKLEVRIVTASSALNVEIERLLHVEMKSAIQRDAPASELARLGDSVEAKVASAIAAPPSTGAKTFFDAFVILVREGFEAILIVGALATYVIRTGQKEKARLLYWGAGAGVVATLALFFMVRAVYAALPWNREILEGVTTLLAVAVLFYVSFWLINKVETAKWNRFIQGKMRGALKTGHNYALVGIAFLAVFREGFEVVLFYQGLYDAASSGMAVTLGVVLGSIVLVAAFVAFYRFGVTLPLRPFFIVTSMLLYYLAVAFMGTGITELQEARLVSTTLVPWLAALVALPVMSTVATFLGVHPTVEALVAQGMLLLAIGGGLLWTFVLEPRRAATKEGVKA